MSIYAKLSELGITLPPVAAPAAAYLPFVQTGNLVFLSGHIAKKDGKVWTGQFGKNHLGDKDDFLPTKHGFDEFFGNLYHLNAEEEPELPDYPKDPAYRARFGPRGVLRTKATDTDDPTIDPRFGKIGKQTIEDTGALTKKRMETIDREVTEKALDFMERAAKSDKPFFLWWNSTRMHIFTHLKCCWTYSGTHPHNNIFWTQAW